MRDERDDAVSGCARVQRVGGVAVKTRSGVLHVAVLERGEFLERVRIAALDILGAGRKLAIDHDRRGNAIVAFAKDGRRRSVQEPTKEKDRQRETEDGEEPPASTWSATLRFDHHAVCSERTEGASSQLRCSSDRRRPVMLAVSHRFPRVGPASLTFGPAAATNKKRALIALGNSGASLTHSHTHRCLGDIRARGNDRASHVEQRSVPVFDESLLGLRFRRDVRASSKILHRPPELSLWTEL